MTDIEIMAYFILTRHSAEPDIIFLISEDADRCWRWLLDNPAEITEFDRQFIRRFKHHWIDRL